MSDRPEDALDQTSDGMTQGHDPDPRSDPRPDIEQAVQARSDALKRGEGGPEPDAMTAPGDYTGNAGTGGEVKNQDVDAQ